jgi:2,4-diketo-3-deoxy-L-fuconate hydrolase
MKICRFNKDRLGLIEGDKVYDVTKALDVIPRATWPAPQGDSLFIHFDAVKRAISQIKSGATAYDITGVKLNNLFTAPTKIMAAPANYAAHAAEASQEGISHGAHAHIAKMDRPVDKLGIFLKANSSAVGPDDGVALKFPDRRNDHEVELCCVIGKGGRDIPRARAFEHIVGYFIGLDMTVRGAEDRSWRKSLDSYTVFGPMVTSDEVKNPENMTIWITVNGEHRQRTSTSKLTVGIPELIELCSSGYELYPGDVLMTGTPEGVGPVAPGDVMRAGGDDLGEFSVKVRTYDRGS